MLFVYILYSTFSKSNNTERQTSYFLKRQSIGNQVQNRCFLCIRQLGSHKLTRVLVAYIDLIVCGQFIFYLCRRNGMMYSLKIQVTARIVSYNFFVRNNIFFYRFHKRLGSQTRYNYYLFSPYFPLSVTTTFSPFEGNSCGPSPCI